MSETFKQDESELVQVSKDATDGWQFTVTAISNALGMYKEEKTISRVLNEVRKVHTNEIKQINVRNGKIFQYYYFINQPLKQGELRVKSEDQKALKTKA